MVQKIAGENGLSPDITSTSVVHKFFQQSNESDWDFLWRLALMHDYEVLVDDTKLVFKPANKADGAAVRAALPGRPPLLPAAHQRRPAAGQRDHPRLGPEGRGGGHQPVGDPAAELEGGHHARPGEPGARRRHDRHRRPRRRRHRRGQGARQRHDQPARRRLLRGRRRRLRQPRHQGRLEGQDRGRRHQLRRRVHGHLVHAQLPRLDRLPDPLPDLRPLVAHDPRADPPAQGPRLVLDRSLSAS